MSITAWSQARLTLVLPVTIVTLGRRPGTWPSTASRRARGSRASSGRRPRLVTGSQRRQACQTPFGAMDAMNTRRPLANWGGESGAIHGDDQLAPEIAVVVDRPQLPARAEPARVEAAAADELARLHVEDVGEVGRDLDLDRQPDRAPAVVDDVDSPRGCRRRRSGRARIDRECRGTGPDVVEERRRS